MAKKQEIKQSEARILCFLENAATELKYASWFLAKLNIDFAYGLAILKSMKNKKWIRGTASKNKVFYELTKKTPLDKAKLRLL